MSLLDQLGGILNQYSAGSNPAPEEAAQHFQQVAQQTPQPMLSGLLSSVFQSQDTGSFGQNIASMFTQSNPQQRSGILNQLVAGAGPGILANFGLGQSVTPQQAEHLSPTDVEQIAEHAQRQNPGVVQQAADFYSQHPQLVQALGAGAAIWALQRFNRH